MRPSPVRPDRRVGNAADDGGERTVGELGLVQYVVGFQDDLAARVRVLVPSDRVFRDLAADLPRPSNVLGNVRGDGEGECQPD
jgi:hypothetical protein